MRACRLFGDHRPQLLILDEPTNYLDLESVEAIETALAEYDVELPVASDDQYFLDRPEIERTIAQQVGAVNAYLASGAGGAGAITSGMTSRAR